MTASEVAPRGYTGVQRGRILVVEDDPAMTEGIRDVLELAGHEVFTASDGQKALEIVGRVSPDLILSDVMMPGMDGFTFYEKVRENPAWTFIPFVFLTALGQRDSITHGKRLGADDYLVKPVDPDHLLATVDARLSRSEALAGAAAHELQKLARMVTGVLGHELRTPITWIRAYSEILLDLRGDMDQDELEAALEGIKSGSDRLARLVEDAVLLVSLDTGQAAEDFRVSAEVEPDFAGRVESLAHDLRFLASASGVEVEVEATSGEDLPPVLVAPRHFAAILRHLVDNGIKFKRPGVPARVVVKVAPDGDGVRLTVEDNGVGIPQEQLGKVFEPLTQVDRLRQEQQGVGLGLSIVRGLVALHGGRVWAESDMGNGTRVFVHLPRANGDLPHTLETPISLADAKRRR